MAGVMRANSEEKNLLLAHWRLGHAYFSLLEEMNLNIFGKCDGKGIVHDACQLVNLRKHHIKWFTTDVKYLSNSYTDIWGPSPYNVDDCCRFSWIFLLKQKSGVTKILKNFGHFIRRQFGTNVIG